jgi:hypothetical protein
LIKTKTVFVLGAGASYPYGLPLGTELYQAVIDDFSANTDVKHADAVVKHEFLNAIGYSERHIQPFIQALRYSGLTSVDAFLERRAEFVEIGKAIIAIELLRRESSPKLWGGASNWMQYLYARMTTDTLEAFTQNQVAFITYNYDRTLEHFLITSLQNTYGRNEPTCAQIMSQIAIIHLHGRLGYLPWQGKNVHVPFQVGGPVDHRILEESQRRIHIVHEDIADRNEEFLIARRLLFEAKRIYFLGFGYAPQNVERLHFR